MKSSAQQQARDAIVLVAVRPGEEEDRPSRPSSRSEQQSSYPGMSGRSTSSSSTTTPSARLAASASRPVATSTVANPAGFERLAHGTATPHRRPRPQPIPNFRLTMGSL